MNSLIDDVEIASMMAQCRFVDWIVRPVRWSRPSSSKWLGSRSTLVQEGGARADCGPETLRGAAGPLSGPDGAWAGSGAGDVKSGGGVPCNRRSGVRHGDKESVDGGTCVDFSDEA